MSAVVERERRVTAGRRMSNLVGKAAQDDETFWSHDVWVDENDSGNDSFRESDEDSDLRVDRFDSDFDDSETDYEEEEVAAGEAAEAELQRQERSTNRKKYVDIAKAGRDLLQKKKGTSRKRKKDLMGDGINAGLMLNLPCTTGGHPGIPPPSSTGSVVPKQQVSNQTKVKTAPSSKQLPKTLASTRSLRSTQAAARRHLRAGTRRKTATADTKARQSSVPHTQQHGKKQLKRFTQEELLLEAATVTEPENERWLLGRKRIQDLENKLSAKAASVQREVRGGKVVSKFHSRRGCFNTLTFPEMDAVPDILARKQTADGSGKRPPKKICVITGKPARYRDPKTKLRYHDLNSFKELRRRLQAGEPLDQRRKKGKKDKNDEAPLSNGVKNEGEVVGEGSDMNDAASAPTTAQKLPQAEKLKSKPSIIKPAPPKPAGTQKVLQASPHKPPESEGARPLSSAQVVGSPAQTAPSTKLVSSTTKGTSALLDSATSNVFQVTTDVDSEVSKTRKVASPTTSLLIHDALAAYAQLKHSHDE